MESLLNRIFDSRTIKLNLDGKTKEKAFVELIDGIASLNPECDSTELFEAVKKREEKMNTGIGCGVGIPHASCRGIEKIAGAIGVSRQGIDYGALDNEPVHVIFLLTMSGHLEEYHLRILSLIAKLAQSKAIDLMKKAKNVQDIQEILSRVSL